MPSMTATEAVSCGMGRRAAKVSHVNVRCWIESAEWFSLCQQCRYLPWQMM